MKNRKKRKVSWKMSLYGFLGLLSFGAFTQHEPLQLFFSAFFCFFFYMKLHPNKRFRILQYFGAMGIIGIAIAIMAVFSIVSV